VALLITDFRLSFLVASLYTMTFVLLMSSSLFLACSVLRRFQGYFKHERKKVSLSLTDFKSLAFDRPWRLFSLLSLSHDIQLHSGCELQAD
jgi:hypothetical protein